jgi:hypothetical protein
MWGNVFAVDTFGNFVMFESFNVTDMPIGEEVVDGFNFGLFSAFLGDKRG